MNSSIVISLLISHFLMWFVIVGLLLRMNHLERLIKLNETYTNWRVQGIANWTREQLNPKPEDRSVFPINVRENNE